jgi:hypothetical protein
VDECFHIIETTTRHGQRLLWTSAEFQEHTVACLYPLIPGKVTYRISFTLRTSRGYEHSEDLALEVYLSQTAWAFVRTSNFETPSYNNKAHGKSE